MIGCAKEGTTLVALVKLALPLCQQAERACPRTGPGRKPVVPDWVMAVLIIVAVLKQRKTKSAQYRYLRARRTTLLACLGTDRFPSRSTYFDRYRRAWRLYEHAIRLAGNRALRGGLAEANSVAVDQSVVRARGPRWNKRQLARKRLPRGADREATWTYSKYHGWILGYSYEVLVSAGKNAPVWPLLASASPASWQPARTFPDKIVHLPQATRHVLGDAGYDSNEHAEAIEWDAHDQPTGRHFLCPQIYRRGEHRRPSAPRVEKGARRLRRQRRNQRRHYFQQPHAQRLYQRRSQTVEPFNDWLKSRFDLHDRAWHRGLDNNRTQLLAAIFSYQLLLFYNYGRGYRNGRVQWILDGL
jgi:hypothetical protein